MQPHPIQHTSIYDRLGDEQLHRLVEYFYAQVAKNEVLKPLFPEDLSTTKAKQFAFLSGFFGGPPRYFETYGHPRLRMRHIPFAIGENEARAWLSCMQQAIDHLKIDPQLKDEMFDVLARTAVHMINT